MIRIRHVVVPLNHNYTVLSLQWGSTHIICCVLLFLPLVVLVAFTTHATITANCTIHHMAVNTGTGIGTCSTVSLQVVVVVVNLPSNTYFYIITATTLNTANYAITNTTNRSRTTTTNGSILPL